MNITPAIFASSLEEINNKLEIISNSVHRVQIDLCDGKFGLERTWLPSDNLEVSFPEEYAYEYDIMANDWKILFQQVINLGAARIIVHTDTFRSGDFEFLEEAMTGKNNNIGIGVSVSNDIPVEKHIENIQKIQKICKHIFIQVMGIVNIGATGQFFDKECIARIKILRACFPGVSIQVDGSMNKDTIPEISEAGADTVVVGSYFFSSEDIGKRLSELENM